jgi:predicted kinase
MASIVITRGLPASGKSTWARSHVQQNDGWVRVNKDDLRAMLHDGKWSKGREKQVISMRDAMVRNALSAGLNVIVDDTNFHPAHIEQISGIAKEFKAGVEIKEFDVPVDECIERDSKRPNPVGAKVIRGMFNQYIRPNMAVKQNHLLPKAVIVDMDGTLALISPERSPYEDDKADKDTLNETVAHVVVAYANAAEAAVLVVSGRDEGRSREVTRKWLDRHRIPYDFIFMRKAGDVRKDAIIKREIFDQHIRDKFYVTAVFDDRLAVTRMWRDDLGLQTFQVDWGDF